MTAKQAIAIFLKGMGMGAADIVPGVSGGTIAFITGIYQRLIDALKSINPKALQVLFKQGVASFWQYVDGTFLVLLLSGIASSFLLLTHIISYALQVYPLILWAFFFGLVLASAWFVGKVINKRCPISWLAFLSGLAIAFSITMTTAVHVEPKNSYIFFAGAIAICAMILPGISGSFILLLLGLYGFIISSIKSFDIGVIALFLAGCLCGLLSFVHLLSFLLKRFYSITMALLTGFLLGSLNTLWPWKQVLEVYVKSDGTEKPWLQANVWPWQFEQLTGQPNQLVWVLLAAVLGFSLVWLLEKLSNSSDS